MHLEAKMIKQVRITEQNLIFAAQVQHTLFPECSAWENYNESVRNLSSNEYYLLYLDEVCIGISGIYQYPSDPASAWLGWFGILPAYRRYGYGSEALGIFEQTARDRGFAYARLYTDRYNNEAAITFYTANGYSGEIYDNPDDPAAFQYPIFVFSKSLTGDPVPPWNNREMNFTEQMKKEKKQPPRFLLSEDIM